MTDLFLDLNVRAYRFAFTNAQLAAENQPDLEHTTLFYLTHNVIY